MIEKIAEIDESSSHLRGNHISKTPSGVAGRRSTNKATQESCYSNLTMENLHQKSGREISNKHQSSTNQPNYDEIKFIQYKPASSIALSNGTSR